jgi:hypothetical protein
MSEEVSREEFDALVDRVKVLEQQLEEQRRYEDTGLDHRDAAVLDVLEEGATYPPRALVKLYVRHTDITNSSTAKTRAKRLNSRSFFERNGGGYQFVGVDDRGE